MMPRRVLWLYGGPLPVRLTRLPRCLRTQPLLLLDALRCRGRDHVLSRLEHVWGPGDGRPVQDLKVAIDQVSGLVVTTVTCCFHRLLILGSIAPQGGTSQSQGLNPDLIVGISCAKIGQRCRHGARLSRRLTSCHSYS